LRFEGTVERAHPDYIVDGLGLLNPALRVPAGFVSGYETLAETGRSTVYRRINRQ
jgi:hypothetical protein